MRPLSSKIFVLVCCVLLAQPGSVLAKSGNSFADRILKVHNKERQSAGVPPLTWSDSLAEEAAAWAEHMADAGTTVHSTQRQRNDHGESLWMGPAGLFSIEVILSTFLAEKKNFKPGTFPDISKTGRWQDSGHYAQVIWPTTTEVGCAMVQRDGKDYLACRYSPASNFIGQPVG